MQGACGRECAAVATKLKARATKTDAMQMIFPSQKLLLRFFSHSASSFSFSSSSSPYSSTASAAAEAALMKAIKNSREELREKKGKRESEEKLTQFRSVRCTSSLPKSFVTVGTN